MSAADAIAWIAERNVADVAEISRVESWLERPRNAATARRAAAFVAQVARAEEPGDRLLPLDSRGVSALLSVLALHSAIRDPTEPQVLVDVWEGREEESPRHHDAAELLAVGSLALGARSDREASLVDVLMHVALSADGMSLLLRRILTDRLDLWDPVDPLRGLVDPVMWLRPELDTCFLRIRQAIGSLGNYASALQSVFDAAVTATADGITALRPDSGSCGDVVTIHGRFPATRPAGTSVSFPRAVSGCQSAQILTWSGSEIRVRVPEEVGDGPVGFVTGIDDAAPSEHVDVGAPMEFAGALLSCIGVSAVRVAGRVSTFAPKELARQTPCPPALPADTNVFHGGPILDSLSSLVATERDVDPVVVTGRNFRAGDAVVIDGYVCPTTFIHPARLEFRVRAVPAGARSARIRRGACRSNLLPLRILPTLEPGPLGRARPGDWLSLKGTGFADGEMFVHLNGEPAVEQVADTYTLDFRVFRPRLSTLPGDRTGERVGVELSHVGSPVGTTSFMLATYRIAIFGDSIAWGQGLVESTKFTTLVAGALADRFAGSIAVSVGDRLAHSGARINPRPGDADPTPDATMPLLPGNFSGELPARVPTVTAQVTAWAALGEEAKDIRMVILDGGINDVDVEVILNPLADDAALVAATRRACRAEMAGLLNLVRGTFPNVDRIIVTGYYPIVSAESNLDSLYGLVAGLGLAASLVTGGVGLPPIGFGPFGSLIIKEWLRGRLIQRSLLFSTTANASLKLAIEGSGDSRIALAIPQFSPSNAIFAPQSYLFGVGVSTAGLFPLDPVAASRLALPLCTFVACTVASMGHPNAAGARAYFDAIRSVL